jgi:glutamine amidotransferase
VIALIDYGSGNLRSVHKALLKIGAEVEVVTRPDEIGSANGVVLPGVGAFDDCVRALGKQELLESCRDFIAKGGAFLGICVGYQVLFDKSEEFNSCAAGLGIIPGNVVRFSGSAGLKVPQIGWNQVEGIKAGCPLFKGIAEGSYFYFVHSFYPQPNDENVVASKTTYGETFASAIWKGNVFATQFHPEKSQNNGLKLLTNFVDFANTHSRQPRVEAAVQMQ